MSRYLSSQRLSSQRLSPQRRFLQRSASANRPLGAAAAQQREEDHEGVDYQTSGDRQGTKGAAVAAGILSGINASRGAAPVHTGPTRGLAAPPAPPVFNDGWANDGWARTDFSSELTPEEQRQRDALRAVSAAQTARDTASRAARNSSSTEVSGSGTWSCWRCGSSNDRQVPTCQSCRAVSLRSGNPSPRPINREGGRDGSASRDRRSDQELAQKWRHITMKPRETVAGAGQTLSSSRPPLVRYEKVADRDNRQSRNDKDSLPPPPLVHYEKVANRDNRQSHNDNDNLRQMRLRREETTKDGRFVGLSPRIRIALEKESSILREPALRSQPSSSILVKKEEPPPAPNVIKIESSGANDFKPPTPTEPPTMTTPTSVPEFAEPVPLEPESIGWTRWSPPQSEPSSSVNREGSSATSDVTCSESEANVPQSPTSPEPPSMTAPTSVPESVESVPLEPESKGWTRWSPPQSEPSPPSISGERSSVISDVTHSESGANVPKLLTLPESPTMTAPTTVPESAESVPLESESKSWTRWSPPQPEPSPSYNREGSSAALNVIQSESGANVPKPLTPSKPPTMTAPSPVPESAPLGSESKGWTRWSPPQSDERQSQPAQPVMQSSQPETPSVVATTGSAPRYAGKDEGHEDVSYYRTRRRAEKFNIDSPSQFVKYESNRPRGRDRSSRRRQVAQEYDEEQDYVATRAERKRQKKKDKAVQRAAAPPTPIILPEFISIANLAGALRVRAEDFTRKMTELGFEETANDHVLDAETAGLIASEFNFEPIVDRSESEDLHARPSAEDKSSLPPRPPVVTIMGHVDHGKTTLLDWLRKSSVAASEHGGITQHIGAFSVSMPSGRIITFLDTPGHAAFLSMRQRGANVTDIVILVVAADDSVKPQTIEAIHHAKAARVPIIVAVNKIDKEDANVERVKLDLGRHGIDVEDFGGDTQVVCVSGKTGQGMDELEDAAIALADILDMRAETDGPAEGWVLEATTKKAGRVATVLVRRGTMHPGDVIVAGNTWARVRSLRNEAGVQIPSAGPGTPVEVDGWREQPAAGDEVLQAPDEQKAKSVIELRLERAQRVQMATDMAAVNEARRLEQEKREREDQLAKTGEDGEEIPAAPEPAPLSIKEIFFIIKADVSGSVEAVLNSISALGNSEIRAHVLRSGVGAVSESDIEHAAAAKGHVVAFNTAVEANISRLAEAAGVDVLESNIIYRLIEDVKGRLEARLTPTTIQKVVGEAEVAQVFDISVKGRVTVPVAGCRVRNGVVSRNGKVRVLRDKEVVFDGMFPRFKIFFCFSLPLPSRLTSSLVPFLHSSAPNIDSSITHTLSGTQLIQHS